jgi:CheY-like chemotaxis protein/HPt (histidine-containing phosphotransfer) domain-containing protein
VMDSKSAAITALTGHNPAVAIKKDQPKRLQGMRILVVEDNKINQAVAHGLLTHEGAIVALADNGRLGVDAVITMQPAYDVVLMDLQMPVMDGFEATRAIRHMLGATRLPIIAMTANAMASDRDACLAAGMNDHVGKPFELDHLVATLQQHTGFAMPADPPVAEALAETGAELADYAPGDLDQDGALARVGGNSAVYSAVLLAFAADMRHTPDQLHAHLAGGDTLQAARVLHTLKGLAATVGARHLAQVAAQLEKTVTSKVDAPSLNTAVATLRSAIEALAETLVPVLNADQEGLQQVPASPRAMAAPQQAQLKKELLALVRLLDTSDMVAIEVFSRVDKAFGMQLGGAIVPLRAAMNALDFAAAAVHCQALLGEKS